MGRDAKPKDQKALQNRNPNPSPDKDLTTDNPVTISELPDPPDYLNEYALAEWNFITPELCRMGVLDKIDRSAIAACCQVCGSFIEAQKHLMKHGRTVESPNGYEMPSPYIAIANKNMELWMKLLKEFGLTPASRKKLGITPPPGESEFEKWQRRKDKSDKNSKKS